MWESKTKTELIIEVWEKLDCESIGRVEIEAIEVAVGDRFGSGAVDSPMTIARLLADEGAELRHSELMALAVERSAESPYAPMFRNAVRTATLDETLSTIKRLENLRRKFRTDEDKQGLKLVRETAIEARKERIEASSDTRRNEIARRVAAESADWLRVWLETPEMAENWIALRRASADFIARFGAPDENNA